MSDRDDAILAALDLDSMRKAERVRELLREEGRLDLLDEYDKRLKDVATGVCQARGVWHALSAAQRRVLQSLAEGRSLVRTAGSFTRFDAVGRTNSLAPMPKLCGIATIRNLCARNLLSPSGTDVLDPEQSFVINEAGRFILKHGPTQFNSDAS